MNTQAMNTQAAIDRIVALIPQDQLTTESLQRKRKEEIARLKRMLEKVSEPTLKILAEGELTNQGMENVQSFAYQLVMDGRYEDKLPEDIEKFAEMHDLTLPNAFLKWANTASEHEFLKTLHMLGNQRMTGASPVQALGVGVIIGGVIVGDAVIAIVSVVSRASGELVVDTSADAAYKL